ncbi:MAG TPA: AgmX/PglI C-terminal domain-containing protein [bacterium]|nr:AgmX/PglI C-terminal domain-containing protein [bacterium]HPS29193.1 AgmX/PglI C-terminal domain-containing protein [bacterium]
MTLNNSDKVLRVGVIHNGKILDEQIFRKPETVFVGDSEKSHFVVPSSSFPSRFPIFYFKSGRYELVVMENMTGKVFLKGKVIEIEEVIKKGMLKKRGNAYILPLSLDSRGKVMVGSAVVIFQFITPPPKAPKLKLPRSIRGSWTQRVDWPFTTIEGVLAIMSYLFFGVYLQNLPDPAPHDFSDIPSRFARMLAPDLDKMEEEVKDDKKALEDLNSKGVASTKKAEEKVDSNAKRPNKPRDAATIQKEESIRVAEIQKKVAGIGLIRMIGSMGEGAQGGVIADVLGDGGKDSDIDTALSGVKQIGIATNSSQRSRKGDVGATETAKIDTLDVKKSDGKIGVQGRSEKAVVGRASVGATEVDGQIDVSSVSQIIKNNEPAVKRCYDKGLLTNPTLKGKVAVSIMINSAGRVEVVDITQDTVGDAAVTQCIKGVVMRLRFPKPDGGAVSVDSSFIFSPSN